MTGLPEGWERVAGIEFRSALNAWLIAMMKAGVPQVGEIAIDAGVALPIIIRQQRAADLVPTECADGVIICGVLFRGERVPEMEAP